MKIIDIVIEILSSIFSILWDILKLFVSLFTKSLPDVYSADFERRGKIASRNGKGFSLGGKLYLSSKQSFQHLFVSAASGMGKSTTVAVPSLFRLCGSEKKRNSIVVLDPAKELYQHTAGHFAKEGYKIITLDFSDTTASHSDGWNPFPKQKTQLSSFIKTLVELELGKGGKDPFWNLQASSLLTSLASSLYGVRPEYQTMGHLLDLVNRMASNNKEVSTFMAAKADEQFWDDFKAFQGNASENTKGGIISSAKAALSVFSEQSIRKITSERTFDVAALRETPHIVYIMTGAAKLETYRTLISLFFQELFSHVLDGIPSDPNQLDLYCLLDEAGIYRIPSLPLALTQTRKFNTGICLMVQDEKQLINLYGHEMASTILSNCNTKLWMTNQPLHTAREIEAISGKTYREDVEGNKHLAPLISADEVRNLSPNKALVLHGHHRLVKMPLKPFYKNRKLKQLTQIAPPSRQQKLKNTSIEFLPKDLLSPILTEPLISLNHEEQGTTETEATRTEASLSPNT